MHHCRVRTPKIVLGRKFRTKSRVNDPFRRRHDPELRELYRCAGRKGVPVTLRGGWKRRERRMAMTNVERRLRLDEANGSPKRYANRAAFGDDVVLEPAHNPHGGGVLKNHQADAFYCHTALFEQPDGLPRYTRKSPYFCDLPFCWGGKLLGLATPKLHGVECRVPDSASYDFGVRLCFK